MIKTIQYYHYQIIGNDGSILADSRNKGINFRGFKGFRKARRMAKSRAISDRFEENKYTIHTQLVGVSDVINHIGYKNS